MGTHYLRPTLQSTTRDLDPKYQNGNQVIRDLSLTSLGSSGAGTNQEAADAPTVGVLSPDRKNLLKYT